MKLHRFVLLMLCFSVWAAPLCAQTKADEHSTHHPAAAASTAEMSEGEIRKVDKDAKKLTIKHGEIKNLDMPAMTMVFQVKDGVAIEKLKAGDKVRFRAEQSGTAYVVTAIESAQ
jgi:Cu(I)/Ag(I) efflux system periplasmic protein CusF